ncbi:type I restriction endonuclease subunit R [Microbacterium sp. zg.Y1090]|uniref:type I restriction endonuclease subunit R n=1 Tax=Microbacterium wangruii TaxID=3049073 RepID=UPI00214D57CD|nr:MULTISPECIES: type I restriction endonuclease subunit R [unclassified Microbacterium]MCR2818931.1 type I restriction endonuclease subunit R [Microbacterium sp. zg.Y1090]WIM27238.1 type I restriction endonuclease subunit R [Microbacterium sp. zg-Y1090]
MTEYDLEQIVLSDLRELGWVTVHGPAIAPGEPHAERSDYRDTILEGRVAEAVRRLNPELAGSAVQDVVSTIKRAESPLVETENWRAYKYLLEGVPVEYRDDEGALRTVRAWLVDWEDVENNDLIAVSQFTIMGPKHERRPDVILFVNGLPMALFELKRPGKEYASVKGAYRQTQTYRAQIPDVFKWNQITVVSDGLFAKAGSFSAPWNHWAPWKTIDGVVKDPKHPAGYKLPEIEVLTKGLFRPEVFFDLCRNYIATYGDGEHTRKAVAKYHQYWAVKKAVDETLRAVDGDGRIGVVWHTQGSGKSLEMAYYAGKVMRAPGMQNPTIIVLTDRNDLDDQLLDDTFASSKIGSPLPEAPVQADSRAHLKELLAGRESGGIVFTTIQKFGLSKADRDAGRKFPLLSDRQNIVVMVDEAHRSNYDVIDGFARHLRDALPHASFIGFTGTPIDERDRSTMEIFGTTIDVYDMTDAQEDGATVKVYYEPRLARIELPEAAREEIDSEFEEIIEEASEGVDEKLKSKWAKVEAIVGSEKRIAELAADIVEHWEARRDVLTGKAMVVTMSRRIAVDLYDAIVKIRPDWHDDDDDKGVIKTVITGNATDPAEFQPHIRNKKMRNSMKARASAAEDPLELVIVRDMWLTGFDSPPMHTMYVDKPMRGASLMQAITRVNRTFKDKPAGLVVDYIGIAENLRDALQTYTKRDKDGRAIGDDVRRSAIPEMLAEHSVVSDMLHGIDWVTILGSGSEKAFLHAVAAIVDHLLESEREQIDASHGDAGEFEGEEGHSLKQRFMAHMRRLKQLYTLVPTSDEAEAIRDDVAFFDAVRQSIAKIEGADRPSADDDAALDTAVRQIVSHHMAGSGVIDIYAEAGLGKPDISLINDAFAKQFETADNQTLQLEMIRRLINQEVKVIAKRNVVAGRQFSEMLAEALNRYQNRAIDAAQVVAEIVEIAKQIKAQRERGERTGLSEDELAFYDALSSNEAAKLVMEEGLMKQIAHELTEIVRNDAKTDWNLKETVRAKLRTRIKRLLLKHGYPPDQEVTATELILKQAEATAGEQ